MGATFGIGPFGILKYTSRAVKAENACDECVNSILATFKKGEYAMKKAFKKSIDKGCSKLGQKAGLNCLTKLPGKLRLACPVIGGVVTAVCKDFMGGGKAAGMIRKITTGEGVLSHRLCIQTHCKGSVFGQFGTYRV